MFDFAWSEFALVGVLALVLIGPKDLPVAIKAASQMLKKARRMAGEFQTHVDDLVREANLQEVRDSIGEIRRMDIKGKLLNAVDGDGTIRGSLVNPMTPATTEFAPPPPPVPVHDNVVSDLMPIHGTPDAVPGIEYGTAPMIAAPPPAFVPPGYAPKPPAPVPPAFIPPQLAAAAKSPAHA